MSSPLSCVSSSASCTCAWIGIDVSKLTLDSCCLLRLCEAAGPQTKRHKRFANTPDGWHKLLDWVQQQTAQVNECHFALEPTGTYGEGLALFLSEQNLRVSLVNPARVRHAALAAGICNKTDKLDAYAIARFCRNENPALYTPPAPEYRRLAALVRRRENLLDSIQQEKNRLDQPHMDKEIKASLTRQVRFLEKEIARVEKARCASTSAAKPIWPPTLRCWKAFLVSARSLPRRSWRSWATHASTPLLVRQPLTPACLRRTIPAAPA